MYLAAESSGKLTTDQIVFEGPGKLGSILIMTNGSVNTKVVLYDGLTATGTILYEVEVVAANRYGGGCIIEKVLPG